MNWGNKLILVFIAFAGLMFFLVYKAMHTRYELVSKEYYQDELRYQDKIDGRANASALSEVAIAWNNEYLVLQLPKELTGKTVTGDIWFYCTTDAVKDLRIPLTANEDGKQFISKNKFKADMYLLKLSWETADKKYYSEKNIEIKMQ